VACGVTHFLLFGRTHGKRKRVLPMGQKICGIGGGDGIVTDDKEVLGIRVLRVASPVVGTGNRDVGVDDGVLVVHEALATIRAKGDARRLHGGKRGGGVTLLSSVDKYTNRNAAGHRPLKGLADRFACELVGRDVDGRGGGVNLFDDRSGTVAPWRKVGFDLCGPNRAGKQDRENADHGEDCGASIHEGTGSFLGLPLPLRTSPIVGGSGMLSGCVRWGRIRSGFVWTVGFFRA